LGNPILRLIETIQCNILLLPEYRLLLEFFPTPQTKMKDQECGQSRVPCSAEQMAQDVKSGLVWDLNQPIRDVAYEWFEKLLLFLTYHKTQMQMYPSLFVQWNHICYK
jgi:hypothetical protein